MIWSKEDLRSLSEKDLCVEVLIPLFRAMGYKDVRYHHGALEQGKDILMWKEEELHGRVNYAVVAKAEKVTGVAPLIGVIATQVHQAFGSTFVDNRTQMTHSPDKVLIVTSHEITEDGHRNLQVALKGAQAHHNVTKIDGDHLWNLVKEYLPHEAVFTSLAEASKALNEVDPDHGYIVELAPKKVHLTAFPSRDKTSPIPVRFEPKFPDTSEGKEQEAAFRRFLASGHRAEIKAEYLAIKGLPGLLETLQQRSPDGTLVLGPRQSSVSLAATLLMRKLGGEEVVLFPLVEFGTNLVGEEEMTLGNDQQPIPFKFRLTLRRAHRSGNFHFDFSEAETNAFALLRAIEFQAALAEGGELIFQDFSTGVRFGLAPTSQGSVEHPGEGFLQELRKLAWIEQQLGLVIPLPERELFTEVDVEDIETIETILRSGRFPHGCSDVQVTFKPEGLRLILAEHADGTLGEMQFVQDYRHNLLGTEVALGPVEITSERARIDPAQLEELNRLSEADEIPAVRIIPEAGEFVVKFRNWPKTSDQRVARHAPDRITEAMDRTVEEAGSEVDEFTRRAAQRVLERSEW